MELKWFYASGSGLIGSNSMIFFLLASHAVYLWAALGIEKCHQIESGKGKMAEDGTLTL